MATDEAPLVTPRTEHMLCGDCEEEITGDSPFVRICASCHEPLHDTCGHVDELLSERSDEPAVFCDLCFYRS